MGPKMRFFKFYRESMHGIYLIFLHEVTVAEKFKINSSDFLGDFVLKFEDQGPKMKFFESYEKSQCLEFFRFFCMK